jgi:hypothetical protein
MVPANFFRRRIYGEWVNVMTNSVQMLEREKSAHQALNNAVLSSINGNVRPATLDPKQVPFELRYSSPVIAMDSQTGVAILQYRDSLSGKETYQIPDKVTLAYEKTQAATSVQAVSESSDSNSSTDSESESKNSGK